MTDAQRRLLAKLDNQQAEALDALLWWVRGFDAAVPPGSARTPNTIALTGLPDVIRSIVWMVRNQGPAE